MPRTCVSELRKVACGCEVGECCKEERDGDDNDEGGSGNDVDGDEGEEGEDGRDSDGGGSSGGEDAENDVRCFNS